MTMALRMWIRVLAADGIACCCLECTDRRIRFLKL